MAEIESLSSCGPQPNCQPPPPRAQAPKPTGVMWISEFPSLRVCMTSPEYWLFGFIRFDVGGRKKLNIPDLGHGGKLFDRLGAYVGVGRRRLRIVDRVSVAVGAGHVKDD